jgi:eukaryotic-like serine/threonine-protein kinase
LGKSDFLAPECTVSGQKPEYRSDLLGLGATLHAMLTGRPPFESKSMPELVKLVRDEVPKKPKGYQLSIHDGFRDIVMELLQKRSEDRYQTPQHLLRDLERVARFSGQSMT